MGGDLNIVFDNDLDRSGHRFGKTGALLSAGLRELQDVGLSDIWRVKHPTVRKYTFYSTAHKTWARIDYFLGTRSVLDLVSDVDIHVLVQLNHVHISLTLALPPCPRTLGTWRLRDTILQHAKHMESLHKSISNYFAENSLPETFKTTLWEALKAVVRGQIITISASDNRFWREKRLELESEVANLESIHKSTGAPRIWRLLRQA